MCIHQCVHLLLVFPNHCYQVTSYPSMYVTPFCFTCLIVKASWHYFIILSDSLTAVDTPCVQVIKLVWRGEEIVM